MARGSAVTIVTGRYCERYPMSVWEKDKGEGGGGPLVVLYVGQQDRKENKLWRTLT